MLVAVCRHVSGHIVGKAVAVVVLGLGVHIQGAYHLPLPGLKQGIVGEGGAAVVAGGGTAIGGFQPGQLLRVAVDYGVKPKVQKVAVVIQVRLALIFGLGHGDLAAAAVGQKTGNLPILAVGVAILLQHTRRVVNAVLGFVGL